MPEEVINSQESNSEGVESKDSTKEDNSKPSEKESSSQFKSIEDAEKSWKDTSSELAKFTNFTKVLTQDGATNKLETMYELNPEETDRFYKKIYGKSYSETKEDTSINEKYGDNPEMAELKKELNSLKKQVDDSSKRNQTTLLDEFVSNNPSVDRETLDKTIANLNPGLDMKEKVNLALSIMSGQGQISEAQNQAYKDAYRKQSAGIVGMGNTMSQDKNSKLSEEDKIKEKFNDKSTFLPGIKKALNK